MEAGNGISPHHLSILFRNLDFIDIERHKRSIADKIAMVFKVQDREKLGDPVICVHAILFNTDVLAESVPEELTVFTNTKIFADRIPI